MSDIGQTTIKYVRTSHVQCSRRIPEPEDRRRGLQKDPPIRHADYRLQNQNKAPQAKLLQLVE
jgi:hypothetical protein